MAALTRPRDTKRREGDFREPVATTKCWQGGMVCLNAGAAVAGVTATGLVCIGVAQNTAEIGERVRTKRGVFLFGNSASGDAIAAADIGSDCWIVDDQTVAKTNGSSTRSKAGKVFDVDAAGVWVEFV
jgi:hypothetical protein